MGILKIPKFPKLGTGMKYLNFTPISNSMRTKLVRILIFNPGKILRFSFWDLVCGLSIL